MLKYFIRNRNKTTIDIDKFFSLLEPKYSLTYQSAGRQVQHFYQFRFGTGKLKKMLSRSKLRLLLKEFWISFRKDKMYNFHTKHRKSILHDPWVCTILTMLVRPSVSS